MTICKVFPFEYVEKKSKVIIYGLGSYGKSYIEQVQATNWCEIIGVSDVDGSREVRDYPFFEIEKLHELNADYIVIAIAAIGVVNQIYRQLIGFGFSDSKIISTLSRTGQDYRYELSVLRKIEKTADCLQILLDVTGGLGDCVVSLSMYEKITNILQNAEIDIRCRKAYGEALYTKKKFLRVIFDDQDVVDVASYDLILRLEHGIKVVKYDEQKCNKYSPELNKKVQLLKETFEDISNDVQASQYRDLVQVRRAIIKGWDRYRTLGQGDVFNLSADMVKIDLAEDYLSDYIELQMGKFITINRGADTRFLGDRQQIKIWPLKYFEQLIPMFKERYPDYEVVQLGSNETEHINGVDRYIKGQNLEMVKYILKNSTLHFDCEGGLVHLATALGTKCAVVFGPTPIEYFGYPQNINIVVGKCHGCVYLRKDWYAECLRGEKEPECMYGITPEIVLEKISKYLNQMRRD